MDQKDFRENLELKPVTQEHIDQFNELLSYVFQVTEADIEESGFENKRAFIRSKKTDFGSIESVRMVPRK